MKTLLLTLFVLVFFASLAQGQSKWDFYRKAAEQREYDRVMSYLFADWKAYKEECDSLFMYDDGYEREAMTRTVYRETLARWRGTTPLDSCGHWKRNRLDFPGFVDWLEKQKK